MNDRIEAVLSFVFFGFLSLVFSMFVFVTGKRNDERQLEVASESKSSTKGIGQPGCFCKVRSNTLPDNNIS